MYKRQPLAHQALLLALDKACDIFVLFEPRLFVRRGDHVEDDLRELFVHAGEGAHPAARGRQNVQQRARRQLAVAGGGVLQQNDVPALLAADGIALGTHLLQHLSLIHILTSLIRPLTRLSN